MKYSTEIIINLPKNKVIEKLDNPENMKHWQRELKDYELLEGESRTVGSKMKLNYDLGKRKMELIETIKKNNFTDEFHATYEAKGMCNLQKNYFEELSDGTTKWTSKNEFIPSSFMLKVMTWVMPGAFKKQSQKHAENFKNFAENGISVSEL